MEKLVYFYTVVTIKDAHCEKKKKISLRCVVGEHEHFVS